MVTRLIMYSSMVGLLVAAALVLGSIVTIWLPTVVIDACVGLGLISIFLMVYHGADLVLKNRVPHATPDGGIPK